MRVFFDILLGLWGAVFFTSCEQGWFILAQKAQALRWSAKFKVFRDSINRRFLRKAYPEHSNVRIKRSVRSRLFVEIQEEKVIALRRSRLF